MSQSTPETVTKSNRDLFIDTFTGSYKEKRDTAQQVAAGAIEPASTDFDRRSQLPAIREGDSFGAFISEQSTVIGGLIRLTRQFQDAQVALDAAREVAGAIYDTAFSGQGREWTPTA